MMMRQKGRHDNERESLAIGCLLVCGSVRSSEQFLGRWLVKGEGA